MTREFRWTKFFDLYSLFWFLYAWSTWKAGCPESNWVKILICEKWVKGISLCQYVFIGLLHRVRTINQSDESLSLEWTTDQFESLWLTALNRLCVPSSSVMRKSWSCCVRSVCATTLHTCSAQVVVAVIEKASYAAFTYFPFVRLQHACKVLVMFVRA
jgi:hypothetical protein